MKAYRILSLSVLCFLATTIFATANQAVVAAKFQDPKIYLPNAFSPNGDGSNDVFRPEFSLSTTILNYDLAVYNSWGAEVFRTQEHTKGWDGWIEGEKATEGAYLYYLRIRYEDETGEHNEIVSGEVVLIR